MNRSESSVEFARLAGMARGCGCGGSSRGRSDKAEAALYSNVKLLLETAGFAVKGQVAAETSAPEPKVDR